MLKHAVVVLALGGSFVSAAFGQANKPATFANSKTAELEQKIAEAKAQIGASQTALAALEQQLADAQAAALDDVIRSARAGDEAAIRVILDMANTDASVDLLRLCQDRQGRGREALPGACSTRCGQTPARCRRPSSAGCWASTAARRPPPGCASCWRRRPIRPSWATPSIALSRCADSPENLAAVKRHTGDARHDQGLLRLLSVWRLRSAAAARRSASRPSSMSRSATRPTPPPCPGEVIVEPATIHCAGFQWKIQGDSNRNCAVNVAYRKVGTRGVEAGLPLLALRDLARAGGFEVPRSTRSARMLAGSIFDLEPETEYEVKLTLKDPDGGEAEKVVKTQDHQGAGDLRRPAHAVRGSAAGPGEARQAGGRRHRHEGRPVPGHRRRRRGGPAGRRDAAAARNVSRAKSALKERGGRQADRLARRGRGQGDPGRHRRAAMPLLHRAELPALREPQLHQGARMAASRPTARRTSSCGAASSSVCRASASSLRAAAASRTRRPARGSETRNCKNWFVLDNEITNRKDWTKARGDATWTGINLYRRAQHHRLQHDPRLLGQHRPRRQQETPAPRLRHRRLWQRSVSGQPTTASRRTTPSTTCASSATA